MFFLTLVLYLFTLPQTNTGFADSDEFIVAAQTFGVVHPPGYPLYTMLTIFVTALPLPLSFAGKANLVSALFHAGVVVNIFLVLFILSKQFLKQFIPRYVIASSTSILLGTMVSFWFHGLFAEVFSLNNFFISLIVLLFILLKEHKTPLSKSTRNTTVLFLSLAVASGLAVSNQQAIILFTPLFFFLLIWVDKKFYQNWKLLGLSICLTVVSFLLPYSYLPIAAQNQSVVNYENPHNLEGMLRSISRKAYNESLGAAYLSTDGITFSQRITGLKLYSAFLADNMSFVVIVFALGGTMYLVLRKKYGVLSLCILGIVGGGLFFALYAPPAVSLYALHELGINQRFYLGSLIFIGILVGFGAIGLYQLISKYDEKYVFFTYAVLACLALYQLSTSWKHIMTLQPSLAPEFGRAVLTSLEKNSVLLCFSEPTCFTTLYIQQSEQLRTDILIIPADIKQQTIEQITQQHPELIKTDIQRNNAYDSVRIVKEIVQQNITKRPLYVAGIEHDPTHLSGYGLQHNPYSLIPQGCAMKIAKDFQYIKKTPLCDSLEKKVLEHEITPKLPLGKMFVNYLGYQRYFNFLVYTEQGCKYKAKVELVAAMNLNPILQYITPQVRKTDKNNCLATEPTPESS